jgi:adhesin/invasin
MHTPWWPLVGHTKLSALLAALAAALSLQGCGGDDLRCGGPFCVTPGPPEATTLAVDSGAGQTGTPGRQLPQPLVVLVTDDDDRPIADVQVSFSVSQGGGALSDITIQSDIEGRARVSWTLGPDAGTQSVNAAASASSGSPLDGSPLTISAEAVRPPPFRIVLQSPPAETARNGVQFDRQPIVVVLDAEDQPVAHVQVTASIASGGGTLSGTTAVSSDATGRATYTDLAILGTAGPRTLRFSVTDPALEVASGPVVLEAGGATEIVGVEPLTYQGTVNSPVSPAPSVVVRDAAGNPVSGVAVTFTADRDASVSPLSITTDQAGVAQVTSWTLGTAANVQYSLTARIASSALSPVIFSAMAGAGAAGRLLVTTQPSTSAQNGAPLSVQPVIQVTDRNGNPTPESGIRVTASVTTGSGTLRNATATTNGAGRASFSGLTITGTVDNYILAFSASGLEGVPSNVIALAPGPAAKLTLASAAPAARSQQPLDPQPSIQVQDVSGNPVGQGGVQITASLTGGGTLGGQATATTDGTGRATFSGLVISGAPGPRTLAFSGTSPALDGFSVPVTLPGVASITIQTSVPASATVGTTISNAPAWVLKDAAGQTVADAPVTLSASAGNLIPAGSVVSDVNGLVQVQSWTLGTATGDQSVVAAVAGTELAHTVHVDATAAAADSLEFVSGNNQTAPINSELPELLVVRVLDQYGNGVLNVTVEWRACEGDGFDGQTNADGYSSSLQPTGPNAGTFCTRASVSGLKGSPVEFTYTVTPASPAPSQLRSSQSSGMRSGGAAPVAPPRTSVVRPYSR